MPLEIERKLSVVLSLPLELMLSRYPGKLYRISQTYLSSPDDCVERRVRTRKPMELNGKTERFYAEKRHVGLCTRDESERPITEAEYSRYIKEADPPLPYH